MRGADGAFPLVEDDGVTEDHQLGEQTVTELTHADKTRKVVIRHPRGTYSDAPTARRYVGLMPRLRLDC
ncbi:MULTISPECIES: DUF5110 domain-containing protein [unclassified Streptomyces]|uniref:DUF5110 domain-containing protein n=1 Tax=unclassified Streptomyces TaxID=2593676 RepID=UPI00338FDFB1